MFFNTEYNTAQQIIIKTDLRILGREAARLARPLNHVILLLKTFESLSYTNSKGLHLKMQNLKMIYFFTGCIPLRPSHFKLAGPQIHQ